MELMCNTRFLTPSNQGGSNEKSNNQHHWDKMEYVTDNNQHHWEMGGRGSLHCDVVELLNALLQRRANV
eukprot:15103184-Ditylum_brightwellii.AAC.2